jgi:hypothetical protein
MKKPPGYILSEATDELKRQEFPKRRSNFSAPSLYELARSPGKEVRGFEKVWALLPILRARGGIITLVNPRLCRGTQGF